VPFASPHVWVPPTLKMPCHHDKTFRRFRSSFAMFFHSDHGLRPRLAHVSATEAFGIGIQQSPERTSITLFFSSQFRLRSRHQCLVRREDPEEGGVRRADTEYVRVPL